MEAFRLGIREGREAVHKTGVGGCIDRMIRANGLKVARVSNDLRDFRQLFQLVGHDTSGRMGFCGFVELRRFKSVGSGVFHEEQLACRMNELAVLLMSVVGGG